MVEVGTVISALIALVGVIITNMMSNRAIENKLVTAQAVTNEKIENLTKAIEKHNKTLEDVPVLEHRIDTVEKRVDRLEERVNTLDRRKA